MGEHRLSRPPLAEGTSCRRLLLSFLASIVWFYNVLPVPSKVPAQLVSATGAGL